MQDSSSQNPQSIFSDDSPEMRRELKENISNATPQNAPMPNIEFQKYFEFIPQVMSVLGYDDAMKLRSMQEFYMGIEAIAFERLIEMLDEPTRNKFTQLIQNTDPNAVDPKMVQEMQLELKSKVDNEKIFKAYFTAITAMVDLTTTDLLKQANEEQEKEIRRILLEQQAKIENMSVNIVPKNAVSSETKEAISKS
jgi:hypothetical protein